MSETRFIEVRDGYAAFLATLTDFKSTRTILGGQVITRRPDTAAEYPAAYLALIAVRKLKDMPMGGPSHVSLEYMCDFGIAVHVNTDGQEIGDITGDDWRLVDVLMNALAPHILSSPNFTAWNPEIMSADSILTETGHSAVYLQFQVKIQWTT